MFESEEWTEWLWKESSEVFKVLFGIQCSVVALFSEFVVLRIQNWNLQLFGLLFFYHDFPGFDYFLCLSWFLSPTTLLGLCDNKSLTFVLVVCDSNPSEQILICLVSVCYYSHIYFCLTFSLIAVFHNTRCWGSGHLGQKPWIIRCSSNKSRGTWKPRGRALSCV